jgi:hypothetical protein
MAILVLHHEPDCGPGGVNSRGNKGIGEMPAGRRGVEWGWRLYPGNRGADRQSMYGVHVGLYGAAHD